MTNNDLVIDGYARFGEVEVAPLGKIRKLVAKNMATSWSQIPHVTHHDEVDISAVQSLVAKHGGFTMLGLVVSAVCETLKAFPKFNASLNTKIDALVLKKFYNIGIAVDTKHGLMVPVIRAADAQRPLNLSEKIRELAESARANRLSLVDVEGGTFTISSLGANGGTAFTPIIKPTEVAILGLSAVLKKPVAIDNSIDIRPILPLSLSYDHRAIDGAMAARFMRHLRGLLEYPDDLLKYGDADTKRL